MDLSLAESVARVEIRLQNLKKRINKGDARTDDDSWIPEIYLEMPWGHFISAAQVTWALLTFSCEYKN